MKKLDSRKSSTTIEPNRLLMSIISLKWYSC